MPKEGGEPKAAMIALAVSEPASKRGLTGMRQYSGMCMAGLRAYQSCRPQCCSPAASPNSPEPCHWTAIQ